MKKLFVIQFLVFISIFANSQVVKLNLPPNSYYRNVNITLKDFTKYEGMKVHISEDSISFIDVNTNQYMDLNFTNIDYLRVKEGNQALKWAGLGALCMGLSAIIAVAEYPDYYRNSGGFIFGFTLSGAVLGGLIGLAVPKWKTYYLEY